MSDTEVVTLHSAKPQPVPEVVEALEKYLQDARDGKIIGFAISGSEQGTGLFHQMVYGHQKVQAGEILLGIELMRWDLMQASWDNAPDDR